MKIALDVMGTDYGPKELVRERTMARRNLCLERYRR